MAAAVVTAAYPSTNKLKQDGTGSSSTGSTTTTTTTKQQPRWRPVRIVDKMLRNLWLVGYIQLLLPRSCVVHVARHPLDVALSCYAQPFGYSSSVLAWSWDLGAIASQLEMSWALAAHWQQQLPGRLHTVLYEELVVHPEAVARRLLDACGLDWEPGVLQFQHTERPVHTASMAQVMGMAAGWPCRIQGLRWLHASVECKRCKQACAACCCCSCFCHADATRSPALRCRCVSRCIRHPSRAGECTSSSWQGCGRAWRR